MKSKLAISPVEREAKTKIERHVVEARERSKSLLKYAQGLHDYLHGGSGGPDLAEAAFKEADAIRYALNSALSGRLARIELTERARNRKKK
jgi:hypothetical protein